MPLTHRSLHLRLPNAAPFDDDYVLETFAGTYLLPIAPSLHWFWFTRYGRPGAWEVRFRLASDDFQAIETQIQHLEATFAHGADGCGVYDYVGDLGGGRFLGQDARDGDRASRAALVYDFLTASARILLASIVQGPGGRWRHETETLSGLNRQTSLESVHHLFCNMTGVPTWAAVIHNPHAGYLRVVSDLDARQIRGSDAQVQLVSLPRIQH